MVQAAASGAFDFTGHDPFDRWWWRRLRWTLNELARRSNFEYHCREHSHRLALLASSRIDSSDWEDNQTKCLEVLDRIHGDLFPWMGDRQVSGISGTEADRLNQLWQEAYGDPTDPAVQEMVARGIAHMQQMATESAET